MVCKFQIFCTKGWIKVYLKVNKTINYHATRLKVLIYDQDYKLDNSPPLPATMAGEGEIYRLFRVFIRLQKRKSCKQACMSITSDSDGQLTVSLRMVTAGQADQAPRRGGRQSSRQQRGSDTQAPSPFPSYCWPCTWPSPDCRAQLALTPCPTPSPLQPPAESWTSRPGPQGGGRQSSREQRGSDTQDPPPSLLLLALHLAVTRLPSLARPNPLPSPFPSPTSSRELD